MFSVLASANVGCGLTRYAAVRSSLLFIRPSVRICRFVVSLDGCTGSFFDRIACVEQNKIPVIARAVLVWKGDVCSTTGKKNKATSRRSKLAALPGAVLRCLKINGCIPRLQPRVRGCVNFFLFQKFP